MVYLEIRLHYLDFAIEKLTSSNWISKYTMCVTGVNWKVKFLSACSIKVVLIILKICMTDNIEYKHFIIIFILIFKKNRWNIIAYLNLLKYRQLESNKKDLISKIIK